MRHPGDSYFEPYLHPLTKGSKRVWGVPNHPALSCFTGSRSAGSTSSTVSMRVGLVVVPRRTAVGSRGLGVFPAV